MAVTKETRLGMNRTGISSSPVDSKALIQSAEEGMPQPHDGTALTVTRVEYADESDPIGTFPPPLTLKGMAKTAMQALQGHNAPLFIDLLGERLAFERTGTRLYQALVAKARPEFSWSGGPSADALRTFQEQELRHFQLIKGTMEQLGADPTAQTPSADVSGVAGMGLLQVVTDPRISLPMSLHALHAAELIDNDAWAMLAQLADKIGLSDEAAQFRAANQEEGLHLQHVRQWLQSYLGQELMRMPR